jgi:hypothetical protein
MRGISPRSAIVRPSSLPSTLRARRSGTSLGSILSLQKRRVGVGVGVESGLSESKAEVLVTSVLWQSQPSEVLRVIRADHSKREEWPDGGASAVW